MTAPFGSSKANPWPKAGEDPKHPVDLTYGRRGPACSVCRGIDQPVRRCAECRSAVVCDPALRDCFSLHLAKRHPKVPA